jgi:hypothetical protein
MMTLPDIDGSVDSIRHPGPVVISFDLTPGQVTGRELYMRDGIFLFWDPSRWYHSAMAQKAGYLGLAQPIQSRCDLLGLFASGYLVLGDCNDPSCVQS